MIPKSILLADDHEIVRRGLRALLQTQAGWQVCGEAVTGHEAVEKAKQLKPDVVVLDIGMPELNGLEAARQILRAVPQTEVLVLTVHESEELVREVLGAGARGYVLKSDAGRDLLAALEAVSRHKPFFTSRVAEIVLEDYRKGRFKDKNVPARNLGETLTSREREIVQLLAEGKSNKEVAACLGISVKTAETHRNNIMRKLGFHSISHLVLYAVRRNIVNP